MSRIRQYQYLVVLLTLVSFGCFPSDPTALVHDMNGMVLGNDKSPDRSFVAGVGDTIAALVARNPYLGPITPVPESGLRLPLLTKLDAVYDDGDLKLVVGCALTTNVDGRRGFNGISSVGFQLCDPSINDWKSATKRAVAVISAFENENPRAENLSQFWNNASELDRKRIGGPSLLMKSNADSDVLRTKDQADLYFAQLAAEGHIRELKYHTGSSTLMGIYLGKKAIFMVGVSKGMVFAGENLTEAQRTAMKYQVTMGFYQRYDVTP